MEVREPSAKYLLGREPQLTELGLIPADWSVSSVGDEFHVQLGKMLDSEKNVGTPKPFLGNRAVQWGCIDVSDIGEIRLSPTDLHRYRLEEGDLLVCEGGEVGRSAIWRGQLDECYYQKALHRLRAKRGYSHEFMALLLEQFARSGKLQDYVTQTSIAHLPKEKFIALPIPRPATDDEQHRIASALTDADALIDSLEQLLTKKRQIKQGAMQELLTGKRRLPGFSGPWSDGVLGNVVAELVAGVSVNSDPSESSADVPSVVKTSAMKAGVFDPSECKPIIQADLARATTTLRKDTLLISRMNTPDLVGEVGYVDRNYDELFLPDRIWMTRMRSPDCVCVRWLGYLLSSAPYKQRIGDTATGTSGSMKNIAKSALLGILVSFPGVDEQQAIAQVLSDMDAEITALESRLTKARALKQAMAQALLTGRIRLVEPTA